MSKFWIKISRGNARLTSEKCLAKISDEEAQAQVNCLTPHPTDRILDLPFS
jgi:hypothetical protein